MVGHRLDLQRADLGIQILQNIGSILFRRGNGGRCGFGLDIIVQEVGNGIRREVHFHFFIGKRKVQIANMNKVQHIAECSGEQIMIVKIARGKAVFGGKLGLKAGESVVVRGVFVIGKIVDIDHLQQGLRFVYRKGLAFRAAQLCLDEAFQQFVQAGECDAALAALLVGGIKI